MRMLARWRLRLKFPQPQSGFCTGHGRVGGLKISGWVPGPRDRRSAAIGLIVRRADAGSPEVLVNTIGTFRLGEALATTPGDLRLLIDANLASALWLSQAAAPAVHAPARQGLHRARVRQTRGRPDRRAGRLRRQPG